MDIASILWTHLGLNMCWSDCAQLWNILRQKWVLNSTKIFKIGKPIWSAVGRHARKIFSRTGKISSKVVLPSIRSQNSKIWRLIELVENRRQHVRDKWLKKLFREHSGGTKKHKEFCDINWSHKMARNGNYCIFLRHHAVFVLTTFPSTSVKQKQASSSVVDSRLWY